MNRIYGIERRNGIWGGAVPIRNRDFARTLNTGTPRYQRWRGWRRKEGGGRVFRGFFFFGCGSPRWELV